MKQLEHVSERISERISDSISRRRHLPSGPGQKRRLLELIERFKSARMLVIGDFILDRFVWGSVDRISPEAPVPVVHVRGESYMPGGSLNVAHNIRTLGGAVDPCGVVGRDREGRMLLKLMRREESLYAKCSSILETIQYGRLPWGRRKACSAIAK